MSRKHADGYILDDQGNRAGRWDDNVHGVRQWAMSHGKDMDAAEEAWRRSGQSHRPIVRKVERYYEANKHRADRGYGKNWLRVLVAFGQYRERGIKPYSAAEARESAKIWRGWEEVALALEGLEETNFEFAHGYDPAASAYQQEGTKDGYISPESARWLNPRQGEGAPETSQIAPVHVIRFCEYLERERALVAKECGSQHPTIKCKVYEGYIEDVRSGERVHSQLMFIYEQFLGWLRGEYGQRTADETTLWADGTVDDHGAAHAAYKAEQDVYADEVGKFQAARDAGEPDAQRGFDEWKRLQTSDGKLFPSNGTYVMDTRTGCYLPFDKVHRQRGKLTAANVRYRLDCNRLDGIRQISWLALNYEGCLCWLPEYDKEKAKKTRMVPAEEVPSLIADGWQVLTAEEYVENQRTKHARSDRFAAFRLYVQYDPSGVPLGVCPAQGDSCTSGGDWQYNRELFAAMQVRE